jgi:GH15 family glucan-1,4-alpha-glucosidase
MLHKYALGIIGNGSWLALINNFGNVSWLCWPQFDSSFLFGNLLDNDKGGDFNVFPNPNSGQFTIEINLLESQHLAINLLDVLGRNISTLINATLSEGSHSFNNDLQLNSGIYLIEIANNKNRQLRKLIVK